MSRIEKLFECIESNNSKVLKQLLVDELLVEIKEVNSFILNKTYKLIISNQWENRICGAQIVKKMNINITMPLFISYDYTGGIEHKEKKIYYQSDGTEYTAHDIDIRKQKEEIRKELGYNEKVEKIEFIEAKDLNYRKKDTVKRRKKVTEVKFNNVIEFVQTLEKNIINEEWYIRHGSILALSGIIRNHNEKEQGDSFNEEETTNNSKVSIYCNNNPITLNNLLLLNILDILENDRFTDFNGDTVIFPVREAASYLLSLLYNRLNKLKNKVIKILINILVSNEDWEAKCAILIALYDIKEYLLQEKEYLSDINMKDIIHYCVTILNSMSDDVRYYSSRVLIYLYSIVDKELLLSYLIKSFEEDEEYSNSKSLMLTLLYKCINDSTGNVLNVNIINIIPYLFKLFRSHIKDIRKNVLLIFINIIEHNKEIEYNILYQCLLLCIENEIVEDDKDILILNNRLIRLIISTISKGTSYGYNGVIEYKDYNINDNNDINNIIRLIIFLITLPLSQCLKKEYFNDNSLYDEYYFKDSGIKFIGLERILQGRIRLIKILSYFNREIKIIENNSMNFIMLSSLIRLYFKIQNNKTTHNINEIDKNIIEQYINKFIEYKNININNFINRIQNRESINPLINSLYILYIRNITFNDFILENIVEYFKREESVTLIEFISEIIIYNTKEYKININTLLYYIYDNIIYHNKNNKLLFKVLRDNIVEYNLYKDIKLFIKNYICNKEKDITNKTNDITITTNKGDTCNKEDNKEKDITNNTNDITITTNKGDITKKFSIAEILIFIQNIIDFIDNISLIDFILPYALKYNNIYIIKAFIKNMKYNEEILLYLIDNVNVRVIVEIIDVQNRVFNILLLRPIIKKLREFNKNIKNVDIKTEKITEKANDKNKSIIKNFGKIKELKDLKNINIPEDTKIERTDAEIAQKCLSLIIPTLHLKYDINELLISENMKELLKKEKDIIEEIFDSKKIKNIKGDVNVELREYQKEGVRWINFLYKIGMNGILADDMGLGKTVQVLVFLSHLLQTLDNNKDKCDISIDKNNTENKNTEDNAYKFLVICPSSLITHWESETKKITNNLIPTIYSNSIPSSFNLLIISYDSFRIEYKKFLGIDFDYLILDEGHLLRNKETLLYKRIIQISAHNKLILSGTPIQNSVNDIYSLFNILMPNYLGAFKEFTSKYNKLIRFRELKTKSFNDKEGEEIIVLLKNLHKKILPFILRRIKEDVLKEIPPKIIRDVIVDLSNKQREVYDGIDSFLEDKYEDNRNEINNKIVNYKKINQTSKDTLKRLNLQLKICSHLGLVEKAVINPNDNSSKMKALGEILNMVENEKVLIFCQYKKTIRFIVDDLLKAMNLTFLILDGSVEPSDRGKVVDNFNSTDISVLLLTTSIGGLGLNLTSATTVIFFEHDWNPFNDLQAMDRAHRIGQKKSVNVIRLLTKNTIEEKVMSLQNFKLFLAASLITEDNKNIELEGILDNRINVVKKKDDISEESESVGDYKNII